MRARAGFVALALTLACSPAIAAPRLRLHSDPRSHLPHLTGSAAHVAAGAPPARAAQTFYVDASAGHDFNPGTSPSAPWRTLAHASRGSYRGGDRILLRGGERFPGVLRFSPANVSATSAQAPLTIGSFGGGHATIAAGRRDAIKVLDVAGVRISELELVGSRSGCRPHTYGILFFAEGTGRILEEGVAIDHVDAHGFCDGVAIGSGDDNSGFAHIRVTEVKAHDNGDAGVFTFDPALGHHDINDVYLSGVQAYNDNGTGGIALFGVEGGTVEHSVA
ncbi:MAG TPA: hypothetical protein VNZ05_05005, partial [Solirubrobacteraceae bacterium]|nr:hypothetical protein [Solirubrobacteraceae bacterium]